MFEDGTPSTYDYDWTRCEAIVKNWPNARTVPPPKLDALMLAYCYPNGRDRQARCNPLELEEVLLELIQEDAKGERPQPIAVANRLGVIRVRNNPGLRDTLERELVDEPADDDVLAHALAAHSAIAPLMRAVAIRHGRNPNPMHDLGACRVCAFQRAEQLALEELAERYGDNWRRKLDPAIEADRQRLEAELGERYPWSVGLEL